MGSGAKGSSPTPSKPYQGPQFDLQQQLLSSMIMGNVVGQNPALLGVFNPNPQLVPQGVQANLLYGGGSSGGGGGGYSQKPGANNFTSSSNNGGWGNSNGNAWAANSSFNGSQSGGNAFNGNSKSQFQFIDPSANKFYPTGGMNTNQMNNGMYKAVSGGFNSGGPQPKGFGGWNAGASYGGAQANMPFINSFKPTGFQNAGDPISGQMFSNTTIGGLPPVVSNPQNAQYNPYQFVEPNVNFTQRNPYQFDLTPKINTPDLYTPQYNLAKSDILEQSNISKEQQLADLNKRGMLTTGAGNRAVALNLQEQDRKLANLASQYSIEQGRMQLQEDQMRRQMEQQRGFQQAEEIFKQQGATDEQAKFLASQNFNFQNAQAGQNLAGFQSNLGGQDQAFKQMLANAQLLMGQQGQAFGQNMEGRKQATAEAQLANLFKRQPMEDLMKLVSGQMGQIGGTEGSAGIWPALAGIAGNVAGAFI